MHVVEPIERDGFVVVPGVLPPALIADLATHVEPLLREYPAGVRALVAKVPAVQRLAQSQAIQPPAQVLERMLSIRLHLDRADENNGALWLSPGSHRLGRLPAGEAAAAADRLGKQLCTVNAGDALLFRPLTLHASRKATVDNPRRVIHLEFANVTLPAPLSWAEGA